jgi:ribosomal protein S18 acetylase RimI-like enzyme
VIAQRLVVRDATPADARALVRCHVACWVEASMPAVDEAFLEAMVTPRRLDDWQAHLVAPDRRTALAADPATGEVVGFSRADVPPGAPAVLQAIYVRAAHHGSGLADTLLRHVLPDGAPASLWVHTANGRARAFYARHGFLADRERGHETRLVRKPRSTST